MKLPTREAQGFAGCDHGAWRWSDGLNFCVCLPLRLPEVVDEPVESDPVAGGPEPRHNTDAHRSDH